MSDREARLQAAKEEIGAAYTGDAQDAAILAHFRIGARRPWCRRVWESAVEICGGKQDAAVQRFYVSTSGVSEGLAHGRLSMENLVVMLAELRPAGWKLPDLPPNVELARDGYIEAMAYLQDPSARAAQRRCPSRDDLAALVALLAAKEWFKLDAEREAARLSGDEVRLKRAEEKLDAVAKRVSKTAAQRTGTTITRDARQLRELQQAWADIWTQCRNAVPFAWAEPT